MSEQHKSQKEPLTEDIIIGSKKISAAELRKFFKKELGPYVYNEKIGELNFTHLMGNRKGKTLKSILDEYSSYKADKDKKIVKPTLEEIANNRLSGDIKANLLGFVAFLRAEKISPGFGGGRWWVAKHKGKAICHISIDNQNYTLQITSFTRPWFADYDKYIANKDLIQFIWDNIQIPTCTGCKGRQNATILGKQFKAVCNCAGMVVKNPDSTKIEHLKKLALIIKQYIADLTAANKG